MHRAHAFDRSVQIVECAGGDHRRKFGGDAIAFVTFVENDCPRRFLRRVNQSFFVKRPHGARIDHFGADSDFLQQRCRTQRHLHHAAGRDQSDILAHALHIRDAQGNRVVVGGHRAFKLVHHLVFEEDDWILVANRSLQQPLGIVRRRRQNHLQSRNVAEPRMQRL